MSFSIGDRVLVPGRATIIAELDADGDYKVIMEGDVYPQYIDAGEVEIDQDYYDDLDDDPDDEDEDDALYDKDLPDSHFNYESRARETDFSTPEVDPISRLLRGGADG